MKEFFNKNNKLFVLAPVFFIDAIGSGLVFPMLPELLLNNNSNSFVKTYDYFGTSVWYGLTIAIFPLMGMIGMPIFGQLSDRYGRKLLLLVGLVGILLSYLLAAISVVFKLLPLFLISRCIIGLCAGTYVVANAIIADMSKSVKERMSSFRWVIFATVIGVVLGPIIGALATTFFGYEYRLITPLLMASLLSLINVILILFFLREKNNFISEKKNKRSILMQIRINILLSVFPIGNYRDSLPLFLSYIFFSWQ